MRRPDGRPTEEGGGATVSQHRRAAATPAVPRDEGGPVGDARLRDFVAGEYARVVATVELVCGSLPTAEDAVQEAMARAVERSRKGEPIDKLAAWVTTVAMNLARSQVRRWGAERRARARLGPSLPAPDGPGLSAEAVAVREALAALPRRQRQVTVLRYYGGLDVAEIAEHLGISEGNVKAMLFRARQALASALGEEDDRAGA
ncbi:MAG: sigma-70 family RNA polymerase sigma factor [Acidimicrobiia bacterium]